MADTASPLPEAPATGRAPKEPAPRPVAFAIRLATLADLDALVGLEERAFSQDRISRRSFRHFLHHRSNRLWVATRGEALLGYVLVLFRRGTALSRVYSIAVSAEARGAGVAGALLDEAERMAVAANCMVMRLEVREDNAPAIALYERRGYHAFGRLLDYYEDHAPARRYQKALTPVPTGLPPAPRGHMYWTEGERGTASRPTPVGEP